MKMAVIKTNHDWTRSDVIWMFHVLISPERSVEIGVHSPTDFYADSGGIWLIAFTSLNPLTCHH